jgi:hypothetical protein
MTVTDGRLVLQYGISAPHPHPAIAHAARNKFKRCHAVVQQLYRKDFNDIRILETKKISGRRGQKQFGEILCIFVDKYLCLLREYGNRRLPL